MTSDDIRRDLLLSRVVGGDATPEEWDHVFELAARDASFGLDLARAQRDHALLERLIAASDRVAARVPAPVHRFDGGGTLTRLGAWAGWLVAACLLFALAGGRLPLGAPAGVQSAGFGAGIIPVASSEDAIRAYLEKGRDEERVVQELPQRILVGTRPVGDVGFEVIYVRQFMERAVVPDLYRLDGQNELGQPSFVRYRDPRGHGM